MTSAQFRYDDTLHEYFDLETGDVVPHITGMLEATGWVDGANFYTEEAADRGTAVHDLTLAYDLGALDAKACVSPYRGWLLAHVAAMKIIRPKWSKLEQPSVHRLFKFGGRTDRAGVMYRAKAVCELKSGVRHKSHRIQLALQAILEAEDFNLSPYQIQRYALYLEGNGKFSLDQHSDRADVDEAYRIIRRCCK